MYESVMGNVYDAKTNPNRIVVPGVADHATQPEIAKLVSQHELELSANDFGYGEGPWSGGRLQQALARHMNKNFKPVVEIQQHDIPMVNGVTTVSELLGCTIAEPGDGILMGSPIY
ncbi:hypothetical protein BAUCODRAFT_23137 [Baudoinia panamericana UAMH 10762]|uniref:Aminotransferase class I/classII domain-containing protein n=1 Tax=Baudoinia panamericana (strain UAMH 10762) TaxID=717646 RepID=M2NH44_BAUPA|nr:uncharacterized protein BAUCODRAFT_23137 [Baudoinia panamericana UAMH 10762]EMC98345.1 hypothetical protein BAUCODRAFT_23137 [Baudoinia panamericana UAMH 10762]